MLWSQSRALDQGDFLVDKQHWMNNLVLVLIFILRTTSTLITLVNHISRQPSGQWMTFNRSCVAHLWRRDCAEVERDLLQRCLFWTCLTTQRLKGFLTCALSARQEVITYRPDSTQLNPHTCKCMHTPSRHSPVHSWPFVPQTRYLFSVFLPIYVNDLHCIKIKS